MKAKKSTQQGLGLDLGLDLGLGLGVQGLFSLLKFMLMFLCSDSYVDPT